MRHQFRAKRRLGQNFLLDSGILARLAEAAELSPADTVLEIGPGTGNLTRELARRAGAVVAVELDRELAPLLAETLAGFDNIHLVWGDFLAQDLPRLWELAPPGPGGARKVAANLPYYITSPILVKLLTGQSAPALAVLLVQQEVAERLLAAPGTRAYGSLSVLVQFYTVPELVLKVPPRAFFPPPEVSSAAVRLRLRSNPPVDVQDPALFFQVVRAAFGQRRKTLLNALLGGLKWEGDKAALAAALKAAGVDPARRGETLSLEEFAALTRAVRSAQADGRR
ncbi:MAG: rRNA (adenine1518-N6/adenine1519-N6)-dimethyltransferase [Bacillota bacterium]|jgi:16S rRNA (adenine1518-N6/adenine1519-N6)-dimethyltransferase|nr:rRNA (adenine1518-N6/adenine1519-N6)-dimethyltransferase [Bacillota bacterium]MDK2925671.1 rRNA (adenine1518-N6/adenine1519-N6)-dimethyltransferase [Bacillota bacterium]